MKKISFILFILGLWLAVIQNTHAEILLSHTLTSVTEGADTASLNVAIHVENTGSKAIGNLTLEYAPLITVAVDPVLISLASIGAGQVVDVPVTIVTMLPFDQTTFEQETLFWAGEHDNPNGSGTLIEFPAKSLHSGGAQ